MTHIRVVRIVTAEPLVTLRPALVNRDFWAFHPNADQNVSLTVNVLQIGLVSTQNVRILVLELAGKEPLVPLSNTIRFATAYRDLQAILALDAVLYPVRVFLSRIF